MILDFFQGNEGKVVIKNICSLFYFPLFKNLRDISAGLLPVNSQIVSMIMVTNVYNVRDFADIKWELKYWLCFIQASVLCLKMLGKCMLNLLWINSQ